MTKVSSKLGQPSKRNDLRTSEFNEISAEIHQICSHIFYLFLVDENTERNGACNSIVRHIHGFHNFQIRNY